MKLQTEKLKKRINSCMGQMIFTSRLHHLFLSNTAVVVAFDCVNNTTAGDGLMYGVEMFEGYCRFFADYFHVVPLRCLVEKLGSGKPVNRGLAITFDDGYGTITNTLPLFLRL